MNERKSTAISGNQARQRLAYTLAAAATTVPLADVQAEIVYSGPQNLEVVLGLEPLALQMNDGDSFADITLSNYAFINGYYQGAFAPFVGGFVVGRAPAKGLNYAAALEEGSLIDGNVPYKVTTGASMAYGAFNPNAQFNDAVGAFLGFAFPINVNEIHYGWLRVDINNAAGTFFVRDWAWENEMNVGILAGDTGGQDLTPGDFDLDGDVDGQDFLLWQRGGSPTGISADDLEDWQTNYGSGSPLLETVTVPEPLTLGLLACGSAGLAIVRRSRAR